MKANELMIGDWVHSKMHDVDTTITDTEGPCRGGDDYRAYWLAHQSCFERHFEDEIEPIPLTEKILKDSGFVPQTVGPYTKNYMLITNDYEDGFILTVNGVMEKPDSFRMLYIPTCNQTYLDLILGSCYVHELQHILRLCGIDKEIVIK